MRKNLTDKQFKELEDYNWKNGGYELLKEIELKDSVIFIFYVLHGNSPKRLYHYQFSHGEILNVTTYTESK